MDENDIIESSHRNFDPVVDSPDNLDRIDTAKDSPSKDKTANSCDEIINSENNIIESSHQNFDSAVDGPDNLDRLDTAKNSPSKDDTVDSCDEIIDSLIDSVVNTSPEPHPNRLITDDPLVNDTADVIENGENLNPNAVDDSEEMLVDGNVDESTAVKSKPDKLCQLPLGGVKRIVRSDPDVPVINAESLFLITKATECFLQWLGKEIYAHTIRQKKKTIQLRDLRSAINEHPALEFLDGALD